MFARQCIARIECHQLHQLFARILRKCTTYGMQRLPERHLSKRQQRSNILQRMSDWMVCRRGKVIVVYNVPRGVFRNTEHQMRRVSQRNIPKRSCKNSMHRVHGWQIRRRREISQLFQLPSGEMETRHGKMYARPFNRLRYIGTVPKSCR